MEPNYCTGPRSLIPVCYFLLDEVDNDGVSKHLSEIAASKSIGLDNIDASLLKYSAVKISDPIWYINCSICSKK